MVLKCFSFCFFILMFSDVYSQHGRYISVHQQTEILEGINKNTNNIDVYFDNQKHIITRHYILPNEHVTIANALGEFKNYNFKTNEVSYNTLQALSSKTSVLYFFVNNITDHLGLADQGFILESSKYEGEFYVTNWIAPVRIKNIAKVKMVHKNGLPAYSEYLDNEDKVLKKTYYTGYYKLPWFRFPQKVIDIAYQPAGDSTIIRTMYSDIRVSDVAESEYFNFEIPDDAKSVTIE